jgi:hypothetical protein
MQQHFTLYKVVRWCFLHGSHYIIVSEVGPILLPVAYPGIFFFLGGGGVGYARNVFFLGVQQIKLRTAGRENGDLGAVPP